MISSRIDFEEPHNLLFEYILMDTYNWSWRQHEIGSSGKKLSSSSASLPLIDKVDIFRFLGQTTAMIHSPHLLAAFRSDESPSPLPCLVVPTLHKALWSIRFSSPEWKSRYIHPESHPLALGNWNFPFSSIPPTIRSHRGQRKINRNSCS